MKNTKNKIKEAARQLFNRQGLADTSLRNIAQELGISQGNLNYHYKTKQDLVEALYYELVAKMDKQLAFATANSVLEALYQSSLQSLTIFYDYRFLLQDLFKICRENETIRQHYMELQVQRKQQFFYLFDSLVQAGIMRAAAYTAEYEQLYLRMQIVGDNWINTQVILYPELEQPIQYFNDVLISMLYPYLTSSGKEELLNAMNS